MKRQLAVLSVISLIMGTMAASDEEKDPANDPRNIERPCPDFNIDCIRNYIWENSQCDISTGPVPDPLSLEYFKVDIANANLTSELNNVHARGLNNAKIIEFYVNCVTNKVVFAIEMYNVEICSPTTLTKYYRKAQEQIERLFHVDFKYDKLTLTAIFPSICDMKLKDADIFTFVDDAAPQYDLGPSETYTSDSVSHQQYQQLFAGIPADLQEVFVRQGSVLMASYIQHNICDFGLEIAKRHTCECCYM